MLLERESSQERYLTKWSWRERTKEVTDLQGCSYERNLALEDAQCDVVNTLISTKEEQKSMHNWKEEAYDIMFPSQKIRHMVILSIVQLCF